MYKTFVIVYQHYIYIRVWIWVITLSSIQSYTWHTKANEWKGQLYIDKKQKVDVMQYEYKRSSTAYKYTQSYSCLICSRITIKWVE